MNLKSAIPGNFTRPKENPCDPEESQGPEARSTDPVDHFIAMGFPAVSFIVAHCLRTRSFTAAGIGT